MTPKQAENAWLWFATAMGIEDWVPKLAILLQDEPPESMSEYQNDGTLGAAGTARTYKDADIWLSPARHKEQGEDMLATLFHEGMHVVAADISIETKEQWATPAMEFTWNRLGDLMAKAYRAKVKP